MKLSIYILIFLFFPVLLYGQSGLYDLLSDNPTEKYTIEQWKVADGLPQNSVRSIVQDTNNYLWIATYSGLVRFDGVKFTLFDVNNVPEFPSNRMNLLYRDLSGHFIIGFEEKGIVRFNPYDKTCRRIMDYKGTRSLLVREVEEASDSSMWMACKEGLYQYFPELDTFKYYGAKEGLKVQNIYSIYINNEGTVYVATISGVMKKKANAKFEWFFHAKGKRLFYPG